VLKKVSLRKIITLQLRKYTKRYCQIYAIHVSDFAGVKGPKLEDYLVLQEFKDVFQEEVLGMSCKRDIYFKINLVPGATLVSKPPHRMSTPKLVELKM